MSLRLSLLLVIAACWIAIGASLAIKQLGVETRSEQPPFFFTLSPDDLRHISISTKEGSTAWHYREDFRRWFFDDEDDVPTSLFRWGGITQLLGGPRTQRELAKSFSDPALYGFDDPELTIRVLLRDNREIVLEMGDLTPDGGAHYARQQDYKELYTVDASWGEVMLRLVNEPPYPDWLYTMDPTEATEILLFEGNEVTSGYGFDEETGHWVICDLPAVDTPCTGTEQIDEKITNDFLTLFGNPEIRGAEVLNLAQPEDFEPYGTHRNAPYVHIRREVQVRERLTNVFRTSMVIGDATPDGEHRYAVANETDDVIKVDREWADEILAMFDLNRQAPN